MSELFTFFVVQCLLNAKKRAEKQQRKFNQAEKLVEIQESVLLEVGCSKSQLFLVASYPNRELNTTYLDFPKFVEYVFDKFVTMS